MISMENMKEVMIFCGEIGYDLSQQNILRPLVKLVYNSTDRVPFKDLRSGR